MSVPSSLEPSSVRARRWTAVAVLSSVALAFGVLARSWINGTFGIDFGVFYAGGELIRESGYDAAYETSTFSTYLASNYFPSLADSTAVSHFISTPTFGWMVQPLSWLPFELSLAAWLLLGAALLLPAVRLLALPDWVVLAVLISPAMTLNSSLGQTGPFVLLLFVALHRAIVSDRPMRAGLLAGLMILKPPLALGYGALWLFQARKWWPAIGLSGLIGIVLSIPTLIGGVDAWRGFAEAMQERTDSEGNWSQQSQSVPEFLKLLAPNSGALTTLTFWGLGLLAAILLVRASVRRWPEDNEMLSAAAIVATIVGSPHLLVYDSTILLIPVAVAFRRDLLTRERSSMLAAIYASSIAFGPVLYGLQFDAIGRGIGAEFPALAACCWLLVRWDNEAADGLVAVLADPRTIDRESEHLVIGE